MVIVLIIFCFIFCFHFACHIVITTAELTNSPGYLQTRWRMSRWACRRPYWSDLQRLENCLWILTQRFWPRSERWPAWRGWTWRSHPLLLYSSRSMTPSNWPAINCKWVLYTLLHICKYVALTQAIWDAFHLIQWNQLVLWDCAHFFFFFIPVNVKWEQTSAG